MDFNIEQCKSWVASRFTVHDDCGIQKRRCRFVDCGKEYSRGTSHMILKRHWARAHADIFSLSPRSRASFGEAPEDRMTLEPRLPTSTRKKSAGSPLKTNNSSPQTKKKANTSFSSQAKPSQGAQFDFKQVAKRLRETPGIHLSFNIHTPKKGGQTLGIITAHTLNETNRVVKSVLLEYKHLPYPNDSTAIYDLLRSCITRFGCREKIISIASSGSDCVTNAIQELDKRYKLSKNYNFSTIHVKCFPQLIHLNVIDVFRSQEILLDGIRKVVNFINHNNFTMRPVNPGDPDVPEGGEGGTVITNDTNANSAKATGLKLPLDVNRLSWNSTFTMIDTFLQQRGFIEPTLSYFQNTQELARITIDWDKLYTLVHLIKPFYQVITGFMEDDYTPVSTVSAIIPRLIDRLSNSTWVYEDLATQANNIRIQLEQYRDEFQSDITLLASLLDPRIKDTFAPIEARQDMIQLLRDRIRDHPPGNPPSLIKDIEIPENSIFRSLFVDEHSDPIADYFERPREVRRIELGSFWECYKWQYPNLYNLAKSLVCVQASSVPADRMFAAAEHFDRDKKGHADPSVPREINRSWANYLEK